MRNKEYWAARALQREQEAYLQGARLSAKLFKEYEDAAKAIRRQVDAFYSKYANKYGLTYEQSVRLLNRVEFQEWKATLKDYVSRIAQTADPEVKALLTAQLDALSANSSISRLEALNGQINLILNDLFDQGVAQMKAEFGEGFVEGYYKKCYDIQSRAGFFNEIAKIDYTAVENALSYPWSGAMFSDRLWQNKQALLFNTRQIVTQGIIQGKSVGEMSTTLSAKMGQSYKNAERLIRTETNYIHGEADKLAYSEAGVEEYEYMATLDTRTCEVCGALDGKIFKLADAQVGVNYPPMHPNDRCTTVEHDPDDAMDWANSGEPMPERTTYQEWYDRQTAKNGQGSVEAERKKVYNQKADVNQYDAYVDRLGNEAPSTFEDFQTLKYNQPDQWSEMKSFYSYKGRVPEASKADFDMCTRIKGTGIYGTVRVPAASIDLSTLTIDAAHVAKKHEATLDEAKGFIENALFSIKRRHQSGATFTNYYSSVGAAFINNGDNVIRTAFKRDQYDAKTIKAVEVAENE